MSEPQRESMEVDILFVGAGPANLASAYHLTRSIEAHNREAERTEAAPIEPPSVLVIEKAEALGEHQLSGAVINPIGIRELMPDFETQGFPTEYVCSRDLFYSFTRKRTIKWPITPPMFRKRGYHIASVSNLVKWLGEKCEALGIEIYPGFAAAEILTEGDRVLGVRTGEMGVDRDGQPKSSFQPGMDIFARCTVLGEGVRGSLTKQLVERFGLEGENPATFETGIKEIWRVRPEKHVPGRVIHGSLFPDFFSHVNGAWLYDMKDDLVSFGFVTPLDSDSPFSDPHRAAQEFKTTPFMRDLLEGGELVRYGAKCVPSGGLYAQPKLYCSGAMLVGDGAGMLNPMKLSGVHLAIKTGMLAADTLLDALRSDDFGAATLGAYAQRYRRSWAYREHREARNFTGSNQVSPLFGMGLNIPLMLITKGRGLIQRIRTRAGHLRMKKLIDLVPARRQPEPFAFDGKLTFSKEHLVQFSGTRHEADQPPHLKVADAELCGTRCAQEYGNPCEHFCPAAVYEMVDDAQSPGGRKLFIHHENCVHCKTCDIADPYQVITWTPPQGGEGPDYEQM